QTVTLSMKLQLAGVSTTVNVEATAPIVDTTTASGGATVDQSMITLLPVARDFYQTARFAPGVTSDATGPTMFGSSGAENKYLIEGLDVTGIQHGAEQKTMLVD